MTRYASPDTSSVSRQGVLGCRQSSKVSVTQYVSPDTSSVSRQGVLGCRQSSKVSVTQYASPDTSSVSRQAFQDSVCWNVGSRANSTDEYTSHSPPVELEAFE
ncbi:hypothetical protein RRG08_042302 [Elysia crispata]|uniref:Uncharacterized protein n=1 Tax=Elysia crispata TaxID=231223 RepID=A0AAE0ZX54_9GAST|nr:hypothetical protein RRG08_042302 [Elysia crispata]